MSTHQKYDQATTRDQLLRQNDIDATPHVDEHKQNGDNDLTNVNKYDGNQDDTSSKGPQWWRSQRYILAYLLMAGDMTMFLQRTNLSIGLICMVNHTAISTTMDVNHGSSSNNNNQSINFDDQEELCTGTKVGGQEREDGPFMWDKETQALLLGAMYWTYLLLQPPGNHMVRNVKRKTVIVASMTLMSTMSLLIHVAALLSPWAVFTVRLVHGGCVAMMVCSMGGMWLRWAPPRERSGLIGIHIAGENIGNVLVFPMSALLCKYGFLGGWPSVYYVHGLLGLIWVCLFYFLADEDPATHKYISEAERRYIQGAIPPITKDETANPPYWSMLTSPAMISIAILQFSFNWGLFLLLSTLPQYMNEVLKFDINSNGVFSMLPYMSLMTVLLVSAPLCDLIIRRGVMSVTAIRKVYAIIGNVIPAILLTIMSYMDCSQPILVVTLLTVAVGLSGFSLCSVLSNPFDIAGPHAIPAYVIENTIATIPGIITPYVVAAFTVDQTRGEWQIVFFITAGVMVLGALIFCTFGSGNLQPWATSSRSPYVIDINRPEGVDLNENQGLRPLVLDVNHGRDVSKTSI